MFEPIHQSFDPSFKPHSFPEMMPATWLSIRNIHLDIQRIIKAAEKIDLFANSAELDKREDGHHIDGEDYRLPETQDPNLDLRLGVDRLMAISKFSIMNDGVLPVREKRLHDMSRQIANLANYIENKINQEIISDDEKHKMHQMIGLTGDSMKNLGARVSESLAVYRSDLAETAMKTMVVASQSIFSAHQRQVIADLLVNVKNGYDPEDDIEQHDHLDLLMEIWSEDKPKRPSDLFGDNSRLTNLSVNRHDLLTEKKRQGLLASELVERFFMTDTNRDLSGLNDVLDEIIDAMIVDRRSYTWLETEKIVETTSVSPLSPIVQFNIARDELSQSVTRLFGKEGSLRDIERVSDQTKALQMFDMGLG
jgi:hypothetical protein